MKNFYVIGIDQDGKEFEWWEDPSAFYGWPTFPEKPLLPEPDFTLEEIEQASEQISSTD